VKTFGLFWSRHGVYVNHYSNPISHFLYIYLTAYNTYWRDHNNHSYFTDAQHNVVQHLVCQVI